MVVGFVDQRQHFVPGDFSTSDGDFQPRPADVAHSIANLHAGLDRLVEMDLESEVPPDARYGGKAANMGRLQRLLDGTFAPYREVGFAIPLHYYFEFMRSNTISEGGREVTYEEYLRDLMRDPEFQSDSERRFTALVEFRKRARDEGTVPDELEQRLAERIEEVFGGRDVTVRFRSSSNVEDALEFNGAGLYESTSVCVLDSFDADGDGPSGCDPEQPEERKIKRALRKVWTSLWTFRAYEERSWYQIPPDDVGMGILVTRAFLDEAANGVAFTGNP